MPWIKLRRWRRSAAGDRREPPRAKPRSRLIGDQRGAIAMIFAVVLVPLILIAALAVDYSFYIQAQSQLNLAADAASLHAVRVATNAYQNGYTTTTSEIQAAQTAGQQWFTAQLGSLATATNAQATVTVNYAPASGIFTASVSYTASLPTYFGSFIAPTLPLSGTAGSTSSAGYVEVVMLIDNSSSMLIGATDADIASLEKATPCSTQSAGAGQPMMGTYAWDYTSSSIGYGSGYTRPPLSPVNGNCDAGYDGAPSACFYVPASITNYNSHGGNCTNGGGVSSVPQAPCAFACHWDSGNNDYYGLSQSLGVTLRLNVIHTAMASVISLLQSYQQIVNQFSVGVYEFNTALSDVYPGAGNGEAGTDLAAATNAVNALVPPVSGNNPESNFPELAPQLASQLAASGNGSTQASPVKYLFIVTDGMMDDTSSGNRVMGPITSATNEQTCQLFKNKGFTVYVLYTPFLPLPNAFYIDYDKQYAEPLATSPIVTALQACATSSATFFQASDPADIQTAMQNMVKSALATSARVSN